MDEKKWYKSKAIWGSLLVVVAVILRAIGSPEQAATIEAEQANIAEWIVQATALVGAALAFIGRLTAKTKITGP